MGRRSRAGILAMACALAVAVSAQVASGHKIAFDTSLQLKASKIDDVTNEYSGKVNSIRAKCEVGRRITVTANGAVVATATSVVGGAWAATGTAPPKNTTLIATVSRKVLKKNKKHRHKCRPDSATRKAP